MHPNHDVRIIVLHVRMYNCSHTAYRTHLYQSNVLWYFSAANVSLLSLISKYVL